ncbi:hypothetical protein [Streptosporangium sp. KLBMP 9127]|nr:hypothetical protein [Streptosporangium sp. KLBMP 9127]
MTDPPQWATRIRTERKARLWDVHTMARHLRRTAGNDPLPDHEALVRSIRRWESGKITALTERYRLLYCGAMGLDEDDLFGGVSPTTGDPSTPLHDLGAMTAFRGADRRVGGGHLYESVLGYLRRDIAPQLFGRPDGSAAFITAAAFTEMAGWMAHDAGQDTTADQHFSQALDLVTVGGDRQLEAHILGSMSHLALHRGCAGDAVRLARRGTDMLTRSRTSAPTMQARLLTMAARSRASLGDPAACTRLLDRAERALNHPQEDEPSPWIGPFDEGSLALDTARSMLTLGQLDEARRQSDRAIALRSPDRARSRAFGQLVLAKVMLAEGCVGEACRLVTGVAEDTRSLSSLVVARELAEIGRRLKAYRGEEIVTACLILLHQAVTERYRLYQWGASDREPGRPAL